MSYPLDHIPAASPGEDIREAHPPAEGLPPPPEVTSWKEELRQPGWGSAAAAASLPHEPRQVAADAGGLPPLAAACSTGSRKVGVGVQPLSPNEAAAGRGSLRTLPAGSGSEPPAAAAFRSMPQVTPISPPAAAGGSPGAAVVSGASDGAAGAPAPAAPPVHPSGRIDEPSLSVAEAARQLAIPERTLRAWIGEGRVAAFRPDPTRRGMRLTLSTLEALRQRMAENGSMPHASSSGSMPQGAPGSGAGEGLVEVLQVRLDGAQAAVRLHAQRRHEEHERHREEMGRLEGELAFLRERMVKAEEAERELRLLLAQQTQASQQAARALQALTEKPALPPPARVRWWLPWKRG